MLYSWVTFQRQSSLLWCCKRSCHILRRRRFSVPIFLPILKAARIKTYHITRILLASRTIPILHDHHRLSHPHENNSFRLQFVHTSQSCQERNNGKSKILDFNFAKYVFDPERHIKLLPTSFGPYMRLIRYDKPIGTFLVWYPGMWSLILATPTGTLPDPYLLAIFTAGAFLMRSSGCIINDLWDRDFDRKVERTRNRPLASGEITDFQALGALGTCLTLALTLLLQLDTYTIGVGVLSLIPITIYPLLKRYTHIPQLGLSLTINWGVLMASSAVNGACDWGVAVPLYLGCCCWTMYYDTIYAHQDKHDDIRIGVKSTALTFGAATKIWLSVFGAGSILCWSHAGAVADQSLPYFLALCFYSFHFIRQIRDLQPDDPDDCLKRFQAEKWMGLVLLVGCLFGTCFHDIKFADDEDAMTVSTVLFWLKSRASSVIDSSAKLKSSLTSLIERSKSERGLLVRKDDDDGEGEDEDEGEGNGEEQMQERLSYNSTSLDDSVVNFSGVDTIAEHFMVDAVPEEETSPQERGAGERRWVVERDPSPLSVRFERKSHEYDTRKLGDQAKPLHIAPNR